MLQEKVMRIDLPGRRIIVTGGTNGIGAACVKAYDRAGAKVVSMDLETLSGRALSTQLLRSKNCLFFHCDVSSGASVDAAFGTAMEILGGLDVMTNVAGMDKAISIEEITETQMRCMLDIQRLISQWRYKSISTKCWMPSFRCKTVFESQRWHRSLYALLSLPTFELLTGQTLTVDGGVVMMGS